MKEFLYDILSLRWWFGVVIVGILVNLLAAYLKPRIDTTLGKFSLWWSTRTKEKKIQFDEAVSRMKNNPHEEIIAHFAEARERLRAVLSLVMGMSLFAFGSIHKFAAHLSLPKYIVLSAAQPNLILTVIYSVGVLSLMLSMFFFESASKIEEQIRAARKQQR